MMRLARPLVTRGLRQIAGAPPGIVSRRLSVKPQALLKTAPGVNATWTQNTEEVLLRIPVAADVRGRDVSLEAHPRRLSVRVRGEELVGGGLADAGEVDVDATFWELETEGNKRVLVVTLGKRHSGLDSWQYLLEQDRPDTSVTHRCYLDVSTGGGRGGRLVLGLYGNIAPRTVENFRALCSGEKGTGKSAEKLHYLGAPFHRIIPGFMAQGGDITLGNGMGGESIYGERFQDEPFKATHSGRGTLAMANAGPNTNGSQFYVTFGPQPHLDGRHVVFGQVEAGWDALALLEGLGTNDGEPTEKVTISGCGEAGLGSDPEALIEDWRRQQAKLEDQGETQTEPERQPTAAA